MAVERNSSCSDTIHRLVSNKLTREDFDELSAFANGSFRGLVHPDDLNRVTHSICVQVASNERGLDNIDYRIIRKDGSVRWVDDYGHLLKNDNKRDLFHVFVADTTEKHQVAAGT